MNGHVERAHRTHTEEFYEVHEIDWRVGELNKQLREWEKTYNEIRPHQSLGYLTPMEWLRQNQADRHKENEPPGKHPNGPSPVWDQTDYTTEAQGSS